MIDPTLCRADRMVGQVLGSVGALPDIYIEIEISYYLLRRLLGVRTEGDKKAAKVKLLDTKVHDLPKIKITDHHNLLSISGPKTFKRGSFNG